ncbi:MAG: hypothetical protein MJE77_47010 [Proteobacteria bacterium]|nr:hypothetical protein [Pseudomonadota bacterium]
MKVIGIRSLVSVGHRGTARLVLGIAMAAVVSMGPLTGCLSEPDPGEPTGQVGHEKETEENVSKVHCAARCGAGTTVVCTGSGWCEARDRDCSGQVGYVACGSEVIECPPFKVDLDCYDASGSDSQGFPRTIDCFATPENHMGGVAYDFTELSGKTMYPPSSSVGYSYVQLTAPNTVVRVRVEATDSCNYEAMDLCVARNQSEPGHCLD